MNVKTQQILLWHSNLKVTIFVVISMELMFWETHQHLDISKNIKTSYLKLFEIDWINIEIGLNPSDLWIVKIITYQQI